MSYYWPTDYNGRFIPSEETVYADGHLPFHATIPDYPGNQDSTVRTQYSKRHAGDFRARTLRSYLIYCFKSSTSNIGEIRILEKGKSLPA